jgi:hypothetical protein
MLCTKVKCDWTRSTPRPDATASVWSLSREVLESDFVDRTRHRVRSALRLALFWARDRTLRFREGPDVSVPNPSTPRRAQLLPLTERVGRAETASDPASGHTSDLLSPPFLCLWRSGTQTPLYRSNSTAFANVLTSPCACVLAFSQSFSQGVSNSLDSKCICSRIWTW